MIIAEYLKNVSWWIPVALTIFIFIISIFLVSKQGIILKKIEILSEETNDKVSEAIGVLTELKIDGVGGAKKNFNGERLNISITPGWSYTTKLKLYRVGDKSSYLFDIGNSFVKNRMSLFLDEYGFLNWRVIDDNYNIHTIRKDFSSFIGEDRRIVLIKTEQNNFKLYTDANEYIEMNLEDSNLSIISTDFYLNSDINGENKFYSESKAKINKYS